MIIRTIHNYWTHWWAHKVRYKPVAFLTVEYASCWVLISSTGPSFEGFLITLFFLFTCFSSSTVSGWHSEVSKSCSMTDQTPWVMTLNSKWQLSLLESIKRTATLERGQPSTSSSFDACRQVAISHASIIAFSAGESWFSGFSNSISSEFCMSFMWDNKAGLTTTANLQNASKLRNSRCGCCFRW